MKKEKRMKLKDLLEVINKNQYIKILYIDYNTGKTFSDINSHNLKEDSFIIKDSLVKEIIPTTTELGTSLLQITCDIPYYM